MNLSVPTFTFDAVGALMSINAQRRTIVTEHSTMGSKFPLLNRLYADAADVGFSMHNRRTGRTVKWVMVEEKRDGDGDLDVTIFAPCSESVRLHPSMEGWTLHVLND